MFVSIAQTAADGLLGVDADSLADTELVEAVVELHRQQTRLAAAVTRITAAADARRVWADDGSRFTGAVRRALQVRDQRCTHHSCDQPGERCQGDHVQAWTAGGTTTADNGQLRCGFHNRWRWQHPDPDPPPDSDLRRRIAHLEDWQARLRTTVIAERVADA